MAIPAKELETSIIGELSPQDRLELERQQQLLGNAFSAPEYTQDPKRGHILAALRLRVDAIRNGNETIEDFLRFQESVFGSRDYTFLQDPHPGLNVNGWRILLAMADPLTYGRNIHHTELKIKGGKRF